MKPPKVVQQAGQAIQTFTDKFPLVGPAVWMVSIQYFIVQLIVASAWNPPYSWLHNTISDLGNTACGQYGTSFVCSPLHTLMNISFAVLGMTMIAGSTLIYQEFKESIWSLIGFTAMGLAGFGTLLVGLFPENTIGALHLTGAFLPFVVGNIGMIILGLTLDVPRWLKIYTTLSGAVSLMAAGLFFFHVNLGLGVGGMERLATHPQTLWLIVFGVYISSNHIRESMATS